MEVCLARHGCDCSYGEQLNGEKEISDCSALWNKWDWEINFGINIGESE